MNTLEISIDKFTQPADVLQDIRNGNLKYGDTLKVSSKEKEVLKSIAAAFLVYYALMYYFKNYMTDKSGSGKLLDEIIMRKSSEEIEREIAQTFGINIQFQSSDKDEQDFTNEKGDWTAMTSNDFAKVYSADEPDYSDVPVREPNPEYIKWKKDK